MSAGPIEEGRESGPVIRDKRRIDPETGALRQQPAPAVEAPAEPAAAAAGSAGEAGEAEAALREQLAERTSDLQRVSAEYANYRRRVDRDRDVVRDLAVGSVLSGLLPVLDDLGRAAEHGELTGGFKAVADALEGVVARFGLERFGTPGEAFDPTRHEALLHEETGPDGEPLAEGAGPVCVRVLQPGYRLGERVLRPARVSVAGA